MTEEKKTQIRKRVFAAEIVLALLMVAYLVYVLVTKNSNSTVFHILTGVILFSVLILNDFVEPYFTKTLEELDEFRKGAYKKYVLCDAAAYIGLLMFIMTFGSDDSTYMFVSVCMFMVGTRKKNEFRKVYMGEITKEDVKAAKEAAAESETIETEAVETEAAEAIEE